MDAERSESISKVTETSAGASDFSGGHGMVTGTLALG
jgi:hypothetical protein